MADAPEGGGGSTFGFLARRIGPVPVWLILVAGGIVIFWWEARANGNTGLFGGLLGRGSTAPSTFSLSDSTGAVTETITGAPDTDDNPKPTPKPRPQPVPVQRGHLPAEKEDDKPARKPAAKPVKAGTPHAGTHVRHNHQNRRAPAPEPGPEVQKISQGPSKFTESGTIPAGTGTTAGSQAAEQMVDVTAHRPLGL